MVRAEPDKLGAEICQPEPPAWSSAWRMINSLSYAGELYDQIRRKEKLSLEAIQFYAAEIVLILQYMRRHKVRQHSR